MRSLAYNPLAVQHSNSVSSQLSKVRPHQLHYASVSAHRVKVDMKANSTRWASNAAAAAAAIPPVVRRDVHCRAAGRQPDSDDETVVAEAGELMNMDAVVRDGWQWTKTNQELVLIKYYLRFTTSVPSISECDHVTSSRIIPFPTFNRSNYVK